MTNSVKIKSHDNKVDLKPIEDSDKVKLYIKGKDKEIEIIFKNLKKLLEFTDQVDLLALSLWQREA